MNLPFEIPPNSKVLIAGAGGGYDFLCGLPIALELQKQGHLIFFSNYSFTDLKAVQNAEWLEEGLLKVSFDSKVKSTGYFPESKLSQWFKVEFNVDIPVFCYSNIGIKSLTTLFNYLCQKYFLTHLIIIDGGVDGIFRGDEYDLGTPSMDSISIISGSLSSFPNKIYSFSAFGTEGIKHEISHAQVLMRVSDLIKQEKMIGVSSLIKGSYSGEKFMRAVRFIYQNSSREHESNIVSSIISSIQGAFGETAVNSKTQERTIWVSPLTSLFWFFNLDAVAKMKLFYEDSLTTDTVEEVSQIGFDLPGM